MTGAEEQELGGWTHRAEGRTGWTDRWADGPGGRKDDWVHARSDGLGGRTGQEHRAEGRTGWEEGLRGREDGLMDPADARTGWMDQ